MPQRCLCIFSAGDRNCVVCWFLYQIKKLRSGAPLSAKEQTIHEQGLVSVLKQIHDELDAAVFEAYGWPVTLTDEEILERLVALNAERAAEEQQGVVRWLRPEFQNPAVVKQKTLALAEPDEEGRLLRARLGNDELAPLKGRRKGGKTATAVAGGATKPARKVAWPKSLPEQIQAVRQLLLTAAQPIGSAELAKLFLRGNAERIEEVLQSLVITGTARRLRGGRYVAA